MESKGSSTSSQPQNASSKDQTTTSREKTTSYTQQKSRISKETLYMVLALWMEDYPPVEEDVGDMKRVGAVLVLPNDMVYAVDCTRSGVHGIARLLMAHPKVLEDCKIFVSRKPCSFCAKLLVQSKVKRVFYLPTEPEYKVENHGEFVKRTARVDALFKVSAISQSVFVPKVEDDVLSTARRNQAASQETRVREKKGELLYSFWNKKWVSEARVDLPWPALNEDMETQVTNDFDNLMEWIARIAVGSIGEKTFSRIKSEDSSKRRIRSFDPTLRPLEREQAEHLITLAKFLAERTDDPKTGVGAVIINKGDDIVGLGWNGFPTKALYGEFPRASKRDRTKQKKYAYVIHAEQNALLLRNSKIIEGGTMFVTMTPCDECTPLIEMQGIETVVLGSKMKRDESKPPHEKKEDKEKEEEAAAAEEEEITYKKLPEKVEKGVFICFEMNECQ